MIPETQFIQMSKVIYEAIKDMGPAGVPSGTLYSAVTEHVDLQTYTRIIDLLVEGSLVGRANHILTALPVDTARIAR